MALPFEKSLATPEEEWNKSISGIEEHSEQKMIDKAADERDLSPSGWVWENNGRITQLTPPMLKKILYKADKKKMMEDVLNSGHLKTIDYPTGEYRAATKQDVEEVSYPIPELPQSHLEISQMTPEEMKEVYPDQFKFPTFQEMTDAVAKEWYKVGNNPYIQMWSEETDPKKKKELEEQAKIYQAEMEKNADEAVKYYNENEQWAPTKWLAENLDAFDLATAPISAGLAPAKVLAKAGPLARLGMEAGIQAGLEGTHAGLEGESVLGGAVGGAASGLLGLYPALKSNRGYGILPSISDYREAQKLRRELIREAEPFMKTDDVLNRTIKSKFGRMNDGPLLTEAEENAWLRRKIPKSGEYEYIPGDYRNPETGILESPGFESNLAKDIENFYYGTPNESYYGGGIGRDGKYHGWSLKDSQKIPRGEKRPFIPTEKNGYPPLYNTLLDLLPERVNPQGNPAYYWDDVVNAYLNWKPKTEAERSFRDKLLVDLLWSGETGKFPKGHWPGSGLPFENISVLKDRSRLLNEDYPGIGLAALQGLYNSADDVAREAMEDMYEGGEEAVEGLRGLYNFSKDTKKTIDDVKKITEDEDLKEGLQFLKNLAKE